MLLEQDKLLQSYIDQKKVPHALLFEGSNMELLEKKARQFVNEYFSTLGSINHSDKLLSDNHPDYQTFNPFSKSGQYTIEQVRDLLGKSQLFPNEAPAQFFVLKHAERMLEAASNAFLKTLEEPAKGSYFIFLTENAGELAPTLRSRMPLISLEVSLEKMTLESLSQMQSLLDRYPKITYNEVHECALAIQTEMDQLLQKKEESFKAIEMNHFAESLFLEFEKWYPKFAKNKPHSYKLFYKALEQARLGFQRAIKLSLCIEHLFLTLLCNL